MCRRLLCRYSPNGSRGNMTLSPKQNPQQIADLGSAPEILDRALALIRIFRPRLPIAALPERHDRLCQNVPPRDCGTFEQTTRSGPDRVPGTTSLRRLKSHRTCMVLSAIIIITSLLTRRHNQSLPRSHIKIPAAEFQISPSRILSLVSRVFYRYRRARIAMSNHGVIAGRIT